MRPRYVEGPPSQPGAGSDPSWIPSTADRFRLLALFGVLTSSATVATRQVALKVETQSGDTVFEKAVVATQAASLAYSYSWSSGSGPAEGGSAAADSIVSDGVPDWWLPAGSKVLVATSALSAGDAWSELWAAFLVGDEWEHLRLLAEVEKAIG